MVHSFGWFVIIKCVHVCIHARRPLLKSEVVNIDDSLDIQKLNWVKNAKHTHKIKKLKIVLSEFLPYILANNMKC